MTDNPRGVKPFMPGDRLKASKFEAMRKGVVKRIRGLLGRESATSAATANVNQSMRERVEILLTQAEDIPAYSLFPIKRESKLDYFWDVNLRAGAFKFEAGLHHATNMDFALAKDSPHWCELVGELPIIVRYEENDGLPKIGHPVGPLDNGKVSIKRCGYVVLGYPDTEEKLVWIAKSNDQMVRIELSEVIKPNERGKAKVVGEMPCGTQCSIQQLRDCEPTIFKDPDNASGGGEFELREILNISGKTLAEGQVLTAHPTLGLGYTIFYDNPDHFKAEAIECHYPEDDGYYYLWVFNVKEDEWQKTGTQDLGNGQVSYAPILVHDKFGNVMLLPGELHDVMPSFNSCGATSWNFVGDKGKFRVGKASSDIECYSQGNVIVLGHEQSSCTGTEYCSVVACNGQQGEEGRRTIYAGEPIYIHYFESTWKILPQPHETEWLGKLTADMCPGDAVGKVEITETLEYCPGIKTPGVQVSSDNLFGLSGKTGARVLLGAHRGQGGEPVTFIKQVEHVSRDIVIVSGEGQGNGDGKFLKYEDCKLEGYVLDKTSQMSCGIPAWKDQIQLYKHYYLDSANLSQEDCDIKLKGYFNYSCNFGEQPQPQGPQALGSAGYDEAEFYDYLELDYDAGDTMESCPAAAVYTFNGTSWDLTTPCEDGCTITEDPNDMVHDPAPEADDTIEVTCERPNLCANPKLALKGRKRKALVCGDSCEPVSQSEDSQGSPCSGTKEYEWLPVEGQFPAWPFVGQWVETRGYNCSCEACVATPPTHNPSSESTSPLSDYSWSAPCECSTSTPSTCCGDVPTPEDETCPIEVIDEVTLTESSAYYRIETTTVDGRKCITLVPISFVTFGDCDEGDPEELICGNPCPEESQ